MRVNDGNTIMGTQMIETTASIATCINLLLFYIGIAKSTVGRCVGHRTDALHQIADNVQLPCIVTNDRHCGPNGAKKQQLATAAICVFLHETSSPDALPLNKSCKLSSSDDKWQLPVACHIETLFFFGCSLLIAKYAGRSHFEILQCHRVVAPTL